MPLLRPVVRRVGDAGLRFNGLTTYMSVPDAPSLRPASLLVEVWAYRIGTIDQAFICKKYSINRDSYHLWWGSGANGAIFTILDADGTTERSSGAKFMSPNAWHQLIGAYDGTEVKVYIDLEAGAPLAIATIIPYAAYDINIGRREYTPPLWYLDGLVGLVRKYNRVLTKSERAWNYLHPRRPILDGCVLWLPFDEASGLTAYDQSGYGNNGTLVNAPTWTEGESTRPRLISPRIV